MNLTEAQASMLESIENESVIVNTQRVEREDDALMFDESIDNTTTP